METKQSGILTILLILFFLCFAGGCSPEVEDSSQPSSLSESQEEAKKQEPGSLRKIERATGSLPDQVSEVTTENLSGYRVPAEYFIIPSKHYPEGVVTVMLPLDYEKHPDKSYPLIIAFGGAGECARSPRSGALAWIDFYKADEAVEALQDNILHPEDFRELVTERQLREFNARLEARPYGGIILACPSSPLIPNGFSVDSPAYEAFVMEEMIPALQRHYRVIPGRVGIDGVSMGGTRSMYYGLKYPQVFASIGSVQGAFGRGFMNLYETLVEKNREVLKNCYIQLVTSDRDSMAPGIRKMHRLLLKNGIPHALLNLTGPHDYIFNQGPGSLSLLLFHSEALRTGAASGDL
jgi:hypothetical protein